MSHSLTPPAAPFAASAPAIASPWLWFVAGLLCAAGLGAGGATLYLMGQQQGAATATATATAPPPPLPAASATTTAVAAIPATLAVSAAPVAAEQVQPAPTPPKASTAGTVHKPKPVVARVHTAPPAAKNVVATPPVEVAEAPRAPAQPEWTPPPPPPPALCTNCGTVESVVPVATESKPSGVGALTGAALVGLLGNQFGRGDGKTLATLAGVVGGAYAGNAVEKQMKQQTTYRLLVRMDDGSARYVEQNAPSFGVGSRVSVQGNQLSPAPSVARQGT